MKPSAIIKYVILLACIMLPTFPARSAVTADDVRVENVVIIPVKEKLKLSADIVIDAMKVSSCSQVYITPMIEDSEGNKMILPSALVNGRSMQIAWERGSVKPGKDIKDVEVAVRRRNGKAQTVRYNSEVPMQVWMWGPTSTVSWRIDIYGCGHFSQSLLKSEEILHVNPADKMRASYMVPALAPLPVTTHEGSAYVQYEVNEAVLHTKPYVGRNGEVIDNTLELKIIDDSISNALKNPNMEIAKISICGYASPDGSYLGNERLATDRSRSLAMYLSGKYNLSAEHCDYSAVAENWAGLRKIVEDDTNISPTLKKDLLSLIDRPVYGPSDYDDKERELRTNPKFKDFFASVILPEWYPLLRVTKFEIRTQLKPMSDDELARIIETDPEKMSLNQMFRVSKLYPEGSPQFNAVMDTMLKYFPDDEAANLNAASAAMKAGDLKKAGELLYKAGDSPEAWNARGILASWRGDMEMATEYFRKAGSLSEASKNLEMLGQ